jgi:diadenosine tetraphosphate (Ap4A) HIT family hydrolase
MAVEGNKGEATMDSGLTEFRAKFRVDELLIERFEHWIWSLRPVHCTLGAGVLSLSRGCIAFGKTTRNETAELAQVVNTVEQKLGRVFKAEKFNYLMLMMVDSHLHFHVIPRYSSVTEFGGITWKDAGWPTAPIINDGIQHMDSPVLAKIVEMLRAGPSTAR